MSEPLPPNFTVAWPTLAHPSASVDEAHPLLCTLLWGDTKADAAGGCKRTTPRLSWCPGRRQHGVSTQTNLCGIKHVSTWCPDTKTGISSPQNKPNYHGLRFGLFCSTKELEFAPQILLTLYSTEGRSEKQKGAGARPGVGGR